ncbi:MAG: class I SAM-dependent methyltransferase [Caulobacteraceae bacterium]
MALSLTGRWLDRAYLAPDVPAPDLTLHTAFPSRALQAADHPGFRMLEIGSREVTGSYGLRSSLAHAEYVGFDVYPGPNVDIVGDAHRLSEHVTGQFDVVYSTAVFEHLAMPWLVAEEIAKVLKVGGMAFIETHFSYSSHERPWNFFQFSDMGLRALFSPALGFDCVEASMQNPIVGRFSWYADRYLRFKPVTGLYCHATLIARKVRDVPDFNWRDADIETIVASTRYPAPALPATTP